MPYFILGKYLQIPEAKFVLSVTFLAPLSFRVFLHSCYTPPKWRLVFSTPIQIFPKIYCCPALTSYSYVTEIVTTAVALHVLFDISYQGLSQTEKKKKKGI